MKVELVYRTLDMEKGKRRVGCNLTKKQAKERFNAMNNENLEYAYIRKFDGWRYIHVKTLKEKNEDKN